MKHLKEFINKYNYKLSDKLIYNSYAVEGLRDSYREGESISVTEILSLIIDPGIEFIKDYYSESLKEACEFGTKTHGELEGNIKYKNLLDSNNELHINYVLGCLKENIVPKISEKMFTMSIEGLPPITGTIDLIAYIEGLETIFDFKTSRTMRNFKSIKSFIQLCFYIKISGIERAALFYLNKNKYFIKHLKDLDYYMDIVDDLIEYTKYLFSKGQIKNLAIK